ncbi:MAG: hypothetical protein ACRDQ5_08770 [Sciscionella sp.]
MPLHSLVELRCSMIVFRGNAVLLIRRGRAGAWVLSVGRPNARKGALARARRVIELLLSPDQPAQPSEVEAGMRPEFATLEELSSVDLQPPLAGHIKGLHRTPHPGTTPYLGDLWRPNVVERVSE